MRQLIFIIVLITSFSCKNIQKKEKLTKKFNTSVKDSTLLRKKALLKAKYNSTPIGVKEIISSNFDESRNLYITNSKGNSEFDLKLFFINKKEGEINKYFKNFYKPSVNSSISSDKYPLYKDKKYIDAIGIKSSNIEYVLPKIGNYYPIVFYVFFNYDKEFDALIDSVRYLVLLDDNLDIVSEFNLDFFHETEDSNFVKFFYIDNEYNIYLRYYKDKGEHGKFSRLIKYKITEEGKIIKV